MDYTNFTLHKKIGTYRKLPKYMSKLHYIGPHSREDIKQNILDLKKDIDMVTKNSYSPRQLDKTIKSYLRHLKTHKNFSKIYKIE